MINAKPESKYMEVEDVTVEKAIRKAIKALHVDRKFINIEVINEEHKGLFGMQGAEPARIRVTLKKPQK